MGAEPHQPPPHQHPLHGWVQEGKQGGRRWDPRIRRCQGRALRTRSRQRAAAPLPLLLIESPAAPALLAVEAQNGSYQALCSLAALIKALRLCVRHRDRGEERDKAGDKERDVTASLCVCWLSHWRF